MEMVKAMKSLMPTFGAYCTVLTFIVEHLLVAMNVLG
jgi:hypothetical protein